MEAIEAIGAYSQYKRPFPKSIQYPQVTGQPSTLPSTRCRPEFCRSSRGIAARRRDFSAGSSRQSDGYPAASIGVAAARVSRLIAGVSVEQTRLRQRPSFWQSGAFWWNVLLVQVSEDFLDHRRILDAGNDPDGATAGSAGLDVDVEHPFQALRLSLIDARRSLGVFSCPSSHALGLLPFPRFAGVTRARCLLLGANTPL